MPPVGFDELFGGEPSNPPLVNNHSEDVWEEIPSELQEINQPMQPNLGHSDSLFEMSMK